MYLKEGLANYSPGAKSSPPLVFLNKVWLEQLFIYCADFQTTTIGSNSFDGDDMAHKTEDIYYVVS